MKKLKYTALSLLFSAISMAQWQTPAGNQSYYGELSYPAVDTAYITGTIGQLYQTLDGGETWDIIQEFGGFSSLHKPQFINGRLGFVNANGGVYRTTDAGVTWDTISADWVNQTGLPFHDLVIGDDYVYAWYEDNGTTQFIRSDDYGDTWTNLVNLPFTSYFLKFDLWQDQYGVIINNDEVDKYYYSTDGFMTVDTITPLNFQELHQGGHLAMVNSAAGINFGQMFNTDQSQRIQASSGGLNDVNLDGFNVLPVLDLDQLNGKLIASSYYGKFFICLNTNATQWTEYNVGIDGPVYSIDFADEDHAIAIIANELRYTKNASTLSSAAEEKIDFKVFPNPFTHAITVDSENEKTYVRIYDLQGNLVYSFKANQTQNLEFLSAGVYVLEVTDGIHSSYQKVIKK